MPMAVLLLGGRFILGLFGPDYAQHSYVLLALLAVSEIPDAITNVYISVLRVELRFRAAAVLNNGMGLGAIVLGTLYACIAIGFSLVWGVLNVINMLHGSFIILGGYLTYFAWHHLGIHPILALPFVAALWRRDRLWWTVSTVSAGLLAAVVYVGGDGLPMYRFIVPIVPLWSILALWLLAVGWPIAAAACDLPEPLGPIMATKAPGRISRSMPRRACIAA